ncbi:MAG: hypothetical protein AAGA05_10940 [Pseudomonadota bacterium]
MTTKRADLIESFSNGKLPTGENFANLINSMVHQDQFDEHVRAFDAWKERGEVILGHGDDAWHMGVNDHAQVRLSRGDTSGAASPADVQIDGWTGFAGRIGACRDADTFAAPKTELDVARLPSVPGDGKWHPIVNMPGHPCVFEITAASARNVYAKSGLMSGVLRLVVGANDEQNAVAHATATATGSGRPALNVMQRPNPGGTWTALGSYIALVIILVLGALLLVGTPSESAVETGLGQFGDWLNALMEKLFAALGITGVDPSKVTHLYLPLAILIINALYALRLLNQGLFRNRKSIRLRWKKTSGSALRDNRSWTLQMRGPAFGPDAEDPDIHYSITKIWN